MGRSSRRVSQCGCKQQHNSAAAVAPQRHLHIFLLKGGVGVNKTEGKPEGRQRNRGEEEARSDRGCEADWRAIVLAGRSNGIRAEKADSWRLCGDKLKTIWHEKHNQTLCLYSAELFLFFVFVLGQRIRGRAARRLLPGFTLCLRAGEESNFVKRCLFPPLSSLLFAVEKTLWVFFFSSIPLSLSFNIIWPKMLF